MTAEQAYAELDRLGVPYTRVQDGRIDNAVRLGFPLMGVDFRYVSHDSSRPHTVDVRQAVAMAHTAQHLRQRGVTAVLHSGIAPSHRDGQHGSGRAIDISGFEVRTEGGGSRRIMLNDAWTTGRSDTRQGQGIRGVVRQSAEEQAQMTEDERFLRDVWGFLETEYDSVVTPAHNRQHWNHFHCGLNSRPR